MDWKLLTVTPRTVLENFLALGVVFDCDKTHEGRKVESARVRKVHN